MYCRCIRDHWPAPTVLTKRKQNYVSRRLNTKYGFMFVLPRVMARDLAMSSVHVSHRPTSNEWYIRTSTQSTKYIYILNRPFWEKIFLRLSWKEGLHCFDVRRKMWLAELYERQQTFLNGEKSICNPHSPLPIQMPQMMYGKWEQCETYQNSWNLSSFSG